MRRGRRADLDPVRPGGRLAGDRPVPPDHAGSLFPVAASVDFKQARGRGRGAGGVLAGGPGRPEDRTGQRSTTSRPPGTATDSATTSATRPTSPPSPWPRSPPTATAPRSSWSAPAGRSWSPSTTSLGPPCPQRRPPLRARTRTSSGSRSGRGSNRVLVQTRQGIGAWAFGLQVSEPSSSPLVGPSNAIGREGLRAFARSHGGDPKNGEALFLDAARTQLRPVPRPRRGRESRPRPLPAWPRSTTRPRSSDPYSTPPPGSRSAISPS